MTVPAFAVYHDVPDDLTDLELVNAGIDALHGWYDIVREEGGTPTGEPVAQVLDVADLDPESLAVVHAAGCGARARMIRVVGPARPPDEILRIWRAGALN